MSGPTKAGEPSMEEILASIRKIIADDPNKTQAEAAPSAPPAAASSTFGLSPGSPALASRPASLPAPAPSAPTASPMADTGNRNNPSFGRLSEALRTTFSSNPPSPQSGSFADTRFGQSAPTSPLSAPERGMTLDPPAPVFGAPSDRARSIDSELDDILDEPLSQPAASESKPADTASASSQWAVWRSPSGKPGDTDAPKPAISGPPPAGSTPAPAMTGFGRQSGGFYPSSSSFGEPSGLPSSTPSTFGKTGRFEPTLPGTENETGGGLGSLVPKRDDAPSAPTVTVARAPRFEPQLRSETSSSSPTSGTSFGAAPAKPAPVVIAAMPPAAPAPAASSSAPPPMSSSSAADASPVTDGTLMPASAPAGGVNVPLPPRTTLFSRPFTPKVEPAAPAPPPPAPQPSAVIPPADRPRAVFSAGPGLNGSDRAAAPATPRAPALPLAAAQVAASASALDALAAGLAASNAQAPAPAVPAAVVASAPVSPQAQLPASGDGTSAAVQPASAASAGPRSLEDMVADMVKPMLQKWISDNMPRIIEKALRSEAGQPGGPKLPGA